ncbi:hypothetical protein OV203_24605 [Nannocystis sp. ILAH1]|uniref:hypothetical protein n=1 Tax=Nannocystis sp. ILAH1 TaxID=2996789 RepID=UPI002270E0BF|nr:hypothetical protein [Nannocystis sp. ILAH1]MCY0990344.1 hypothetical protein [Nannocystis sp. ILAH1]
MPGLPARLLVLVAALAACTERDPLDSDTVTDSTGMSEGTGASTDAGTTAPPSTTDEPPTGSIPGDPTTTPTSEPATTGPNQPSLSHAVHIQPIWDANCVVGCHTPGGTSHAWFVLSDNAFASIVERPALELPQMMLVAPGDLDGSYLWHKVTGLHIEVGGSGVLMPPAPADALSTGDLDTIAQWILQGCPP